jgi:uncharacterized membrane protein YidH (DUF202 family)
MTVSDARVTLAPDIDSEEPAKFAKPGPRPEHTTEQAVPPIPDVDVSHPDLGSLQYSLHRTRLSTHRTGLSEHRTALSEHRTDLSIYRTDLSTERTELSMRRTGMSFQRTRLSADRTLMSVIRTSLSLISFGFTIYQVFEKLREQQVLTSAAAARNFGITLVLLGVLMLVLGIAYHVRFMVELRRERAAMAEAGYVHAQSGFPVSMTLITATLLLLIGAFAVASMVFHVGPFG